jgi:hypothetical protein
VKQAALQYEVQQTLAARAAHKEANYTALHSTVMDGHKFVAELDRYSHHYKYFYCILLLYYMMACAMMCAVQQWAGSTLCTQSSKHSTPHAHTT